MKTLPPPVRRLRIPELIQQVRDELVEVSSLHQASGKPTTLTIQKVTLEINVAVSAETSGSGEIGASVWVLDFKTSAARTARSEQVHKVTVEMSVQAPGVPAALARGLPAASAGPELRPALSPARP